MPASRATCYRGRQHAVRVQGRRLVKGPGLLRFKDGSGVQERLPRRQTEGIQRYEALMGRAVNVREARGGRAEAHVLAEAVAAWRGDNHVQVRRALMGLELCHRKVWAKNNVPQLCKR